MTDYNTILAALEQALAEGVTPAIAIENPEGWQEVDGVRLPPIDWAERVERNIDVDLANTHLDGWPPRPTGHDAIDLRNDHISDMRKHER